MSEQNEFVSCFRINGRPILPPVMTPRRRSEMQEYKLKALAVEQKLKERKLLKEKKIMDTELSSKNEDFEMEEDKENKLTAKSENSKNMLNVTKVMKEPVKLLFSERSCLKEVPFQCNPMYSKLSPLLGEETVAYDDYPEDGACSLAPTESTDLHPYLDSTLEDVSPDLGSNFDCQESTQLKRRSTYIVTGHTNTHEFFDTSAISAKVSALESIFADVKFSPVVNLENCISKLASSNVPVTISDKLDISIKNAVDKSLYASASIKSDANIARNAEMEDQAVINDQSLVDHLNSQNAYSKDPSPVKNSTNMLGDNLEGTHVPPLSSSFDSVPIDYVGGASTSASEGNLKEDSSSSSPPRLVRRGSYTLDSPSPILSANIDRFKVNAVPACDTTDVNGAEDIVIDDPNRKCGAAELLKETIVHKNSDFTKTCTLKDFTESVECSNEVREKTSVTVAKPVRNKMSFKKQSSQERMNIPPTKGSVFERLAADGAKKAEERRKWTKENVFKIPGVKKAPKATKGQLRTAVSTSNIRSSLTEAYRKSSSSLASRRCNSDVSISSVALGKGWQSSASTQQKRNMALPSQMPNRQRMVKLKKSKSSDDNSRVIAPTANANPTNLKLSQPMNIQDNKEPSSDVTQHVSSFSPKKQMYIVQTSPISPPLKSILVGGATEVDAAALRRKRRRWSESREGWTNFVEPNCSTPVRDQFLSNSLNSSKKNVKNSETLEKMVTYKDILLKDPEKTEACPDVFSHQDSEALKTSETKQEHHGLRIDEIAEITDNVECVEGCENTGKPEISLSECNSEVLLENDQNDIQKDEKENVNSVGELESVDCFLYSEKEVPVITTSYPICEVSKDLQNKDMDVNFPSPPTEEVTTHLNKPIEAIATVVTLNNVSNALSDLVHINKNVDSAVENNAEKCANDRMGKRRSFSSPPAKISRDLQHTIDSLPETPLGPHGTKDMAFHLLGRLVDEQEKAMAHLLEEQRLQAENMQKKFKEQQKYLVGRLARLVNTLPSPKNKEATHSVCVNLSASNNQTQNDCVCKQSHISVRNPTTLVRTDICHSQMNQSSRKSADGAISTLPVFEEIGGNNECQEVSLAPSISYSISPLSPSNFIDPNSVVGMENMISEPKEYYDNMSINISDYPKIICSLCQICHSPPNTCKCSLGDSGNYSSTLKEEVTSVNIDSVTCKSSPGVTEDLSALEKTVCQLSPGLVQKNNQSMVTSTSQDLNSSDMLKGMESSTMIEGSTGQNVDLDLSGILEMESREKNMSFPSTEPLEAINVLQDTCSSGISSVNHSKIQMSNEMIMDELSLHRQKYKEDFCRLSEVESHPRSLAKEIVGISHCIVKTSPLVTKGINLTRVEDCPVSTRKVSFIQEQEAKNDTQSYLQSDLPDLRSDVLALQTYLGLQTPSTGPVTLETSISTPRYQRNENIDSHLTSDEHLADRTSANTSHESLKEKELMQDDAECRVLKLMIGESEAEKNHDYNPNEYLLPIRSSSSGSTSGSSSGRRCLNSDGSPSSSQYTTATSSSQIPVSYLGESESEVLKKFSKLNALVKGYLTRRLLKTARVLNIKTTIQDSLMTALKLHSEVPTDEDVNPADIHLHGRIIAQLTAACNELYHVCFGLSVAQQMAIINADRQRLNSRTSTPIVYDADVAPSPRPALLSAVTLKTLQRRFGNELPVKKGAANFKSRSKVKSECSKNRFRSPSEARQRKTGKVEDCADWVRHTRTRARSFVFSSTDLVKGSSTGYRKQSVSRGTEVKTADVKVKSKLCSRKSRRSSSASDVNRKPWR